MTDDADRLVLVEREAADDGVIVGEAAVAMQLVEAREQAGDVVERVGPRRMARDEHALPGRQARVQFAADFLGAAAQRLDRPQAVGRLRQHAEGFDLLQQHADRFFEFK